MPRERCSLPPSTTCSPTSLSDTYARCTKSLPKMNRARPQRIPRLEKEVGKKVDMSETKNVNSPGVAEEVLAILRCLSCQGKLRESASGLVCASGGREYPMLQGVLRFVDAQNDAGRLGFRWKLSARTKLDGAAS